MQLIRRPGEVLVADNGFEVAQLAKLHAAPLSQIQINQIQYLCCLDQ
jgi:hypothetical protein